MSKRLEKENSDIERLAEIIKQGKKQEPFWFNYLFSPNYTEEMKFAAWLYDNGYRYLKVADKVKKKKEKV